MSVVTSGPIALTEAATLDGEAVLHALDTTRAGLTDAEARRRLASVGPNAVRSHRVAAWRILAHQFNNPIQLLLLVAAAISILVGEGTDAAVVLCIVVLSLSLGFVNEYRSERVVEALHDRIRHTVDVRRDGRAKDIDVTDLVPGDIVTLRLGQLVPADLRLLETIDLECDEAVLTGESEGIAKDSALHAERSSPLDLPSCGLMGTIVRGGRGEGVVVATGGRTEFGRIALELGRRHERTSFEAGLRDFAGTLLRITGVLVLIILVINLWRGHGAIETAMFALAVAVGLTPQLLPAIVSLALSRGSRLLAQGGVVVKRLVAIEDLGNVDVLFTDKTGTLTEGAVAFVQATSPIGIGDREVWRLAKLCADVSTDGAGVSGGSPIDRALWAPNDGPDTDSFVVLTRHPFDHERRLVSAVVEDRSSHEKMLIAQGAPEVVLDRCATVSASVRDYLQARFAEGSRVIAVAVKPASIDPIDAGNEFGLTLRGFVEFHDPPKSDVGDSLAQLARLGIAVKVLTGDNATVAASLCGRVGLHVDGVLTGAEIEAMGDDELSTRLTTTTVFARVSPIQKAQIVRLQRAMGSTVAFLGDGVNDSIAMHDADVGISVESATDVAKDAASVVLMEKDLGVLAFGVTEGRKIFANTMKYVLMATSSNFGNMFSLVAASLLVPFLPLLPSQVLLNNLLYDVSQSAIPTDNVDEEQLRRPAHWDIHFIRSFMFTFGPLSSLFDLATFAVLLIVFHARDNESLFQSGWFVESLLTQTLVVFVIRTRRSPFWHSRPSRPLIVTTSICALVAVTLPFGPVGKAFSLEPISIALLITIAALAVTYLLFIELVKNRFYRTTLGRGRSIATRRPFHVRRIERRASKFSSKSMPPADEEGDLAA